jgi:hypothetical protein
MKQEQVFAQNFVQLQEVPKVTVRQHEGGVVRIEQQSSPTSGRTSTHTGTSTGTSTSTATSTSTGTSTRTTTRQTAACQPLHHED